MIKFMVLLHFYDRSQFKMTEFIGQSLQLLEVETVQDLIDSIGSVSDRNSVIGCKEPRFPLVLPELIRSYGPSTVVRVMQVLPWVIPAEN